MYKTKPHFETHEIDVMAPVTVLALNASLKHSADLSNTAELADLVIQPILAHAPKSSAMVAAPGRSHADYVETPNLACRMACTHADWRSHGGNYR